MRGKERSQVPSWLPIPIFSSLEQVDRIKRMMLGLPVPNISRVTPFGYVISKTDPDWCIPSERAFLALVQVKRYLKDCTYPVAAEWLSKAAGMPISSEGLRKLLKHRPPLTDIVYMTLEEREELAHNYGLRLPESLRGKASSEQEQGKETQALYAQVKEDL